MPADTASCYVPYTVTLLAATKVGSFFAACGAAGSCGTRAAGTTSTMRLDSLHSRSSSSSSNNSRLCLPHRQQQQGHQCQVLHTRPLSVCLPDYCCQYTTPIATQAAGWAVIEHKEPTCMQVGIWSCRCNQTVWIVCMLLCRAQHGQRLQPARAAQQQLPSPTRWAWAVRPL
jgi:hypothetical protein